MSVELSAMILKIYLSLDLAEITACKSFALEYGK